MEDYDSLHGHSTKDALNILHEELSKEIEEYEKREKAKPALTKFKQSFLYHKEITSVFHWTSLLILVVLAILLFVAYGFQEYKDIWLVVEALVILFLCVLNVLFLGWHHRCKQFEVAEKAKDVLRQIKAFSSQELSWDSSNYIHPHAPLSPCVTLQWTIRDHDIINLPCGFLVEGDIILLRPGQIVPAHCKVMTMDSDTLLSQEYKEGDCYNPEITSVNNEKESHNAQPKIPLKPQPCILLETPYVKNIRLMLDKSTERPPSVLNQERYLVYSVGVERRLLPVFACALLLVNALRYFFVGGSVGHWTEMFIVLQIHGILPLTALVYPLIWTVLDVYGNAKILAFYNVSQDMPHSIEESFDSQNSLAQQPEVKWKEIKQHITSIMSGQSMTLARSANVVHALGNMTSFCCVDKKGILSWPNPTAEKVFFLRNEKQSLHSKRNSKVSKLSSPEGSNQMIQEMFGQDFTVESNFEVLDLTQDAKNGYSLQFDDPNWKRYINSLKPLGLNILLNTCNMDSVSKYTNFADHITCASLKREHSVPVVNRR